MILQKQRTPYDAVASQKKVLKRMGGLAPGGGNWKDFKTGILMEMGLTMFAKMEAALPTITLLHLIAHVTDEDLAYHGQDIAFIGDRMGRRFPTAYTLPKESPWQWKEHKFVDNLMELKTHYDKADSGRAP